MTTYAFPAMPNMPVLMKELRSRMRGKRGPLLILLFAGLAVTVGLLVLGLGMSDAGNGNGHEMARIGRALFIALTILEALLCMLIAPALTAGAISLEREQQTLDLLFLTRLSNMNILLGKYLSSLSFMLLLLLCALPVNALCFLLGGVSFGEFFQAQALNFAIMLLAGAVGLYTSVRSRKTVTSVVSAYALVVGGFVAAPAAFAILLGVLYPDVQSNYQAYATQPPLALVTLIATACAVMPALLLSALVALFTRRPLPSWANLLLYLAVAGIGLGISCKYIIGLLMMFRANPLPLLVGHPGLAYIVLFMMNEITRNATIGTWVVTNFVALTLGELLLFTLAAFIFAQVHFRKLRDGGRLGKWAHPRSH